MSDPTRKSSIVSNSEEAGTRTTSRTSKRTIKNLDLTKDDILQDDIKRDQIIETTQKSLKKEMDDCSNAPYNAFNYQTKTHKDPIDEAKNYIAKQEVYEIFKKVTFGLVLNKPNDPIKSMIEQLRVIQAKQNTD